MRIIKTIAPLLVLSPYLIGCATTQIAPDKMASSRYRVYMKMANHASSNNLSTQLNLYKQALIDEPQSVNEAEIKIADLYLKKRDFQQAKTYYQASLKKNSQDKRAQKGLVQSYLGLKQEQSALEQVGESLKSDAHDRQSINELAFILDTVGQHKEARSCYRQGLQESPTDVSLMNNIALSYLLDGKVADSIHSMQSALYSYPNQKRVLNNLHVAEKAKEIQQQYNRRTGKDYAHRYVIDRLHFKELHNQALAKSATKLADTFCHSVSKQQRLLAEQAIRPQNIQPESQRKPVTQIAQSKAPQQSEQPRRPATLQFAQLKKQTIVPGHNPFQPSSQVKAKQLAKQQTKPRPKHVAKNKSTDIDQQAFLASINQDFERGIKQTQQRQTQSIQHMKLEPSKLNNGLGKKPTPRPSLSAQIAHATRVANAKHTNKPKQEVAIGFMLTENLILPKAKTITQSVARQSIPKPMRLMKNKRAKRTPVHTPKLIRHASRFVAKHKARIVTMEPKIKRAPQQAHIKPQPAPQAKRRPSLAVKQPVTLKQPVRYELVLMESSDQQAVAAYLAAHPLKQAKLSKKTQQGKTTYRVTLGRYSNYESATIALFDLPIEWQRYSPSVASTA